MPKQPDFLPLRPEALDDLCAHITGATTLAESDRAMLVADIRKRGGVTREAWEVIDPLLENEELLIGGEIADREDVLASLPADEDREVAGVAGSVFAQASRGMAGVVAGVEKGMQQALEEDDRQQAEEIRRQLRRSA